MISGLNYIGEELKADGSKTFKTINPVLNEHNSWTFIEANENEINEASELAWQAFIKFRNTSKEERAAFLIKIAEEIENLGEELILTYTLESGLSKERALSERARTCYQLRSFADVLENGTFSEKVVELALPERKPLPKPDLRKSYIPLGPVAVFGSSNFPLAYSTAGGDTASALAAGCPVIIKSHPMHAATGELVASAVIKSAQETNMPNGVFSNLNSSGIEVGVSLANNFRIKAIGFTGSIKGGRALMDLASKRKEPIPVFAEMGSINPVIISQNSLKRDKTKWAKTYASSITQGTGQFCTNPGLLLGIESSELDSFAELLAKSIAEIEPKVMLGPNIKRAYNSLKSEISTQNGVHILGEDIQTQGNYAGQRVVSVTGFNFLENPKLHQEVFGPFSMIVKCADKDELLQIIEGLEGQLTGTIIAEEDEYNNLSDLVDVLKYRVGRIIFNGVPTGVEVTKAMNHGGPYPASSDLRFTAVGTDSITRWIRPIAYQNFPKFLLPLELK